MVTRFFYLAPPGDGHGASITYEPEAIGSHSYFVRCAALSPSGKLLASGDEDSIASIWHLDRDQGAVILRGHRDAVYCLAFVDEDRLVTGSWDRTVRVWDTKSGQCLRTMYGHDDRVERVCVGSGMIISADESGSVLEFPLEDGLPVTRWAAHENRIRALSPLGADGWISAGDDGRVVRRYFGLPQLRQVAWLPSACYGLAGPVADGRWVALGSAGMAWLLDLNECAPSNLVQDQAYLRSVSVSPTGKRLACGGKSGIIRILDPTDKMPESAIQLSHSILALSWIGETRVVGCGRNGLVFVLTESTAGAWYGQGLAAHTDHVFALAVDPLSERFYTGGFDGRIMRWSPA